MSDYTEHLISMAGGGGDVLEAIEARAQGLTDLCPEHLRQSIRHVRRNVDIDCNVHEDENTWDDCKQPDRYDGDRMAAALADIPALLAMVREQRGQILEAKAGALEEAAEVIESRAKNFAAFWVDKDMTDLAKGSWSAMAHEARHLRARAAAVRGES